VFVISLTVMFWDISLAVAIGREYIGSTTLKNNSNMMVVLSVDDVSVFVIPLTVMFWDISLAVAIGRE
jgi:hypothetical protein